MNLLQGKVAVITGGNSGIGLATAKEFIKEGAKVVITGRNQKSVDDAVLSLGSSATGIVSDAARMEDLKKLKDEVSRFHSSIDILFVNAGISINASIADATEEQFDQLFNINVKGAYFTVQQLLTVMNEHGSIILNSSATVHRGFAGVSMYAGSKAAVATFAKTMSLELLPRKIRVNVVSPGPVSTAIYDKMGFPLAQAEAVFSESVPMKRFGKPEEIASLVRFLASPESSFITGEEIIAAGGVATL